MEEYDVTENVDYVIFLWKTTLDQQCLSTLCDTALSLKQYEMLKKTLSRS